MFVSHRMQVTLTSTCLSLCVWNWCHKDVKIYMPVCMKLIPQRRYSLHASACVFEIDTIKPSCTRMIAMKRRGSEIEQGLLNSICRWEFICCVLILNSSVCTGPSVWSDYVVSFKFLNWCNLICGISPFSFVWRWKDSGGW